ncbi:hypothetical protein B0H16DRAFT_1480740 [Mycena metata]|uniref:Uncharacterized protein n=1 Tax=Mycena metata TaxID=1033252 RepID=A0AAD7MC09_9AGAR|nr:hypothetical protein B0H16DRAFT_1480740 [Mycena metata]
MISPPRAKASQSSQKSNYEDMSCLGIVRMHSLPIPWFQVWSRVVPKGPRLAVFAFENACFPPASGHQHRDASGESRAFELGAPLTQSNIEKQEVSVAVPQGHPNHATTTRLQDLLSYYCYLHGLYIYAVQVRRRQASAKWMDAANGRGMGLRCIRQVDGRGGRARRTCAAEDRGGRARWMGTVNVHSEMRGGRARRMRAVDVCAGWARWMRAVDVRAGWARRTGEVDCFGVGTKWIREVDVCGGRARWKAVVEHAQWMCAEEGCGELSETRGGRARRMRAVDVRAGWAQWMRGGCARRNGRSGRARWMCAQDVRGGRVRGDVRGGRARGCVCGDVRGGRARRKGTADVRGEWAQGTCVVDVRGASARWMCADVVHGGRARWRRKGAADVCSGRARRNVRGGHAWRKCAVDVRGAMDVDARGGDVCGNVRGGRAQRMCAVDAHEGTCVVDVRGGRGRRKGAEYMRGGCVRRKGAAERRGRPAQWTWAAEVRGGCARRMYAEDGDGREDSLDVRKRRGGGENLGWEKERKKESADSRKGSMLTTYVTPVRSSRSMLSAKARSAMSRWGVMSEKERGGEGRRFCPAWGSEKAMDGGEGGCIRRHARWKDAGMGVAYGRSPLLRRGPERRQEGKGDRKVKVGEGKKGEQAKKGGGIQRVSSAALGESGGFCDASRPWVLKPGCKSKEDRPKRQREEGGRKRGKEGGRREGGRRVEHEVERKKGRKGGPAAKATLSGSISSLPSVPFPALYPCTSSLPAGLTNGAEAVDQSTALWWREEDVASGPEWAGLT